MTSQKPAALLRDKYTVGWICAIPIELEAARSMLDVIHGELESQALEDKNIYTLGSIKEHNIAILCLPEYGVVSAATAAKSMQFTFPKLRFGLMVGIGGGIPSEKNDIRLGDIVVSQPTGTDGGVVQYDLGRMENGYFQRVGSLNKPPVLLTNATRNLQSFRTTLPKEITSLVNKAHELDGESKDEWTYPTRAQDILFKTEYPHIKENKTCNECVKVPDSITMRDSRLTKYPQIHYGNIASGNLVMKNAELRDILGEKQNVICFEMEAAGLMDSFPCLVIRGICDYSDSHKKGKWQPYAAAVAAAYAKKLLLVISPLAVTLLDTLNGKPIHPLYQ